MTQWYVKDLSRLTGVSVQTLHHYDRIELLKPSVRLNNGYRLYSEKDLLKLQQIIALKFFGFKLARIKILMKEEINIFDHFRAQQQFLEQQVKSLQVASQTLETILCESGLNKSVPWETILKLIEDYQMTKELKHDWVTKALNTTELKEYATFEQGLKTRFTEQEAEASRQKWLDLVKEIEANLDKDPTSDFGVDMGQRCWDWVKAVFPKEHATLRKSLWEKGFKGGYTEVSAEVVAWLDKAMGTYIRGRIYTLLDQVDQKSSPELIKAWKALMEEMYGDNESFKQELIQIALADDRVKQSARKWLQQFSKGH